MIKFWSACLVAGAAALPAFADHSTAPAAGISFIDTEHFATLPDGVRFPEGIAANPATGDIFVGTFDFGPNSNKLLRIDHNGHVSAIRDFGATPLLGLEFAGGKVYILNFGASSLQRMPANFDATTPVETVAVMPSIGAPPDRMENNPDGSFDTIMFGSSGKAAPNGMVIDSSGNAYISDSFQGAIFEVPNVAGCPAPSCPVLTISHDTLLGTAGTPPFGANGLALSADEKTLFIANTGDHRVLKMDVASHAVSVFSISLFGADGLLFNNGTLWVATNQADQVVALNAAGRIVIKAGEFLGVREDGTPRGLLFPASMAVVGNFMYVTNLALPLTAPNDDEPEDFVRHWTISRFHVPH
jgi:sugar lactone lactonase YvrE